MSSAGRWPVPAGAGIAAVADFGVAVVAAVGRQLIH